MGYYSEIAIDDTCHEDYSYPSPEMQLRWRIEDLQSRLADIPERYLDVTAHCHMGCRYPKEDLAYASPQCFSRVSDIMAAISIAEERLALMDAEESNIQLNETPMPKTAVLPRQLTIWDNLPIEFVEQSESQVKAAA